MTDKVSPEQLHDEALATVAQPPMGPIADLIRTALALAREEATANRQTDPARGRAASLVATHLETALLYALFSDRVE